MRIGIILLAIFLPAALQAQTGPGGVGDTTGKSFLQLWLMANSGTSTTTNGAAISKWKDNSGAGNHMTGGGGGGTKPEFRTNEVNGLPGIRFKGDQYFTGGASNATFQDTEATVIAVKRGKGEGVMVNIGRTQYENEFLILNDMAYHHMSSGNFTEWKHHTFDTINKDTPVIITAVFGKKKTDLQYFVNAVITNKSHWESVSGVPDYFIINKYISIGRRNLTGTNVFEAFDGTLMEVIGFNKKLSAAQLDSVHDYLKCKYGIGKVSGCATLSAEKINITPTLAVYPNPSSGNFQISLPENSDWTLRLVNAAGQCIQSTDIRNGELFLVKDQAPGLLFVSATNLRTGKTLPAVKVVVR